MFDWLNNFTPPTNLDSSGLTAYVLLDVFLIIGLARILGSLMVKIGQPRVVGEILAGVLLGPTLLGSNLSQFIAPMQVRPVLNAIATIGLILFMFIAGIEFDMKQVKGRIGQAGLLALLSVAVPAALGFLIAPAMHNATYAGPTGADPLPFAVLIGAALSVTAFPVMAHILMERGELNTRMGSLAVATAGMMSVLMFTYIAFAGTVARGDGLGGLAGTIALIAGFILVTWFVARPLLNRALTRMTAPDGSVSGNGMGLVLGGLMLYGLIAHIIGIHALIGGFGWGTTVPQNSALRKALAGRVRDLAMVHFLPVFFAMAGFSTDLKLITAETLPVVGLVLLGAIGGKFLAAMPARAFGLTWSEVGTLGALFNTRGLLVLVAGLIGLQLQIITNLTFTITVVVALVTNLMTLPLLKLFAWPQKQAVPVMAKEAA